MAAISKAAHKLCATAEASDWRGPDVYDALWRSWPAALVGGRRRRQIVIQLHARMPIDIRRLHRREHPRLAKGLAVFAQAELRLHEATGSTDRLGAAGGALELLADDHTAGKAGWGYPFDMQTRWSFYARHTPNIVVTSFAAVALQEGARALERSDYAARARTAAGWIQDELFVDALGVYVYHPDTRSVIHNANLLGASVAWRLLGSDASVRDAVSRSVERSLAAQAPDGAFAYGEDSSLGFVDSFHTGYVLDCLCDVADIDPRVPEAIARGAAYYSERFFDSEGRSLLWPQRAYPEDAHAAGTGMTVLSRLSARGLVDRELVRRVAERAATAMVRRGHAVHRRHRWGPTRVRYLRWCDAHMALGLANATRLLDGAASTA